MLNSSLFLAHPTNWDKCSASKNTQDTSWSWFWVLKVPIKVWVLEQSKSAMLCCVLHVALLAFVIRVMNVRNQPCQSFVTGLAHLCTDQKKSRRPFVPTKHVDQFASKLLTTLQLFQLLPVWIADNPNEDAKLCEVAPLSSLPIHGNVQHIFERVPPCRKTMLLFVREFSAITVIFCYSSWNTWLKHLRVLFKWLFHSVCIPAECVPNMVKNWCGFVNTHFFFQKKNLLHWTPYSASLQPFWWQQHILTEIDLVSDERTYSNSEISPIQLTKLLSVSYGNPAHGWPYKSRSRKITACFFLPMILAIDVAERVSKNPDVLN